jgi:ubiquinone/menaquinone biosynthesis C-methylase UbiE
MIMQFRSANFFRDQRLADIYDALHPDRSDLDPYLGIVAEFNAQTIVDVGAGTGTFGCRLAILGKTVIAVEPAQASSNVAQRKAGSDRVRWIVGDAASIPAADADLLSMTGNVPEQMSDDQLAATLAAAHRALRPGGHIAFGNRDAARQSWLTPGWSTSERVESTPEGAVTHGLEVIDVTPTTFTFRWTFVFETDGEEMTWETTFRLRSVDEIRAALEAAAFEAIDVRDDEDAYIFIAAR